MGLLVTLTELLGRLTVVTPLLEHFLRNRADSGAPLQKSFSELQASHQELGNTLEAGLREQHSRLSRLEDSVARAVNRLAEMSNEREKQDAEMRKVQGTLRAILGVATAVFLAALLILGLLVFRGH